MGGGAVAERKVAGLLEAGGRLTVLSPWISPALVAFANEGRFAWWPREYAPGDAAGFVLVLVATDDRTVNAEVAAEARARGILVNCADDFVLGRGGEEVLACRAAGIPVDVVPGVSSAVAVPAAVGIPVTHRGLGSSFAVVTGHEDPAKAGGHIHWEGLARAVDTLVILMGAAMLRVIAARLIAAGRDAATPAAVIERGTTAAQRSVTGTLGDIAERASALGPPAVVVIGPVAGLGLAIGPPAAGECLAARM